MLYANLIFLLLLLWALIAVVIKQQRQRQAVNAQLQRMQKFYSLSAKPHVPLEEQLHDILTAGCEMLDADFALVLEVDPAAGIGEVRYFQPHRNLDLTVKNRTLHVDDTACIKAFNTPGATLLQGDYAPQLDVQRIFESDTDIQHYLGAPLYVNGEPFGCLGFYWQQPRTHDQANLDEELVKLISSWVRVLQERLLAQQEMQAAKNSAEAANQAKSYFLANMSHEIRTPLTTILGYAETLMESESLDNSDRQVVETISEAGKHLHAVLNDILDLTKIEAGQLLVEELPTSPIKLVEQVKKLVYPALDAKRLSFDIDIHYPMPKSIITDPTRLKQILINLCNNAIKFTNSGGVTVRMRYLEPMQQLQFTVIDTGIGMDEEELSRILQPFAQADASISRKYGGSGLGLYISQQLVSQLGGYLSFTSRKGKGTEIDFTIAAKAEDIQLYDDDADVSDFAEEEDTAPSNFSGNVLLVEDNEHNHALIKFHLDKLGLQTDFAVNGQQAVDILSSKEYDVVLMDTNMPVMDGETAIRTLRKNGYKKPIISLTANALVADRERCLAAGANDYLTKPLDLPHFNATIKKYLTMTSESQPEQAKKEQPKNNNSDLLQDPKFRKLAAQFVQHLPEKVQQLQQAADSGDWQTVKDVSHNLKGLGGGYGLYDITDAAKALNDAMKAEEIDRGPALLGELCKVCEQVVQQFDAG